MLENRYRVVLVFFTSVTLVAIFVLAAVTSNTTFNQLEIETTLLENEPIPTASPLEINDSLQWALYRTKDPLLLPIEYAFFALFLTALWLLYYKRGRRTFAALLIVTFGVWAYGFYDDGGLMLNRSERAEDETIFQELELTAADWLTNWLGWGIAFLLAVALLGVLYWAWKRWFDRPPVTNDEFATVAQTALAELDAGASLEDVIRWSYEAMQTAVRNRRQLNRRAGMTVREFEERLVANGLPADAVKNLSRLFEQVRYGQYTATVRDEQVARSALQAVVTACGGTL